MDWRQYITTDPGILHGVACFAGTCIPVTVVLDNLADGAAPVNILHVYTALRAGHIAAALGYAADLAHDRATPVAQTG